MLCGRSVHPELQKSIPAIARDGQMGVVCGLARTIPCGLARTIPQILLVGANAYMDLLSDIASYQ